MACGKAHTVVYTRSGKLFSFGSNAEGQLGVGRTPEYSDVPMQLSTKEVIREEVVKLAAGSVHSMALGRKSGELVTEQFLNSAKKNCVLLYYCRSNLHLGKQHRWSVGPWSRYGGDDIHPCSVETSIQS